MLSGVSDNGEWKLRTIRAFVDENVRTRKNVWWVVGERTTKRLFHVVVNVRKLF